MIQIIEGDFNDQRVVDLLHLHLTSARAETAPGSAHALDLTGLQSPDISLCVRVCSPELMAWWNPTLEERRLTFHSQ